MGHDPAIRTVGLCKRYGRTIVLDAVDVTVAAGRTTVLLGANGAGKSTLVRLVLGLARPSSGDVEVLGGRPDAVKGRVGVLFEDPHLYPHLSGRENLHMLSGRDDEDRRLAALLDVLGLDPGLLARRARGYSFGQRRRLTLAAVMHRRPELLVLDEPTNGLDPDGVAAFLDVCATATSEGATMLITGQDLAAFDALAQDTLVLRNGGITAHENWSAQRLAMPSSLRLRSARPEVLLVHLGELPAGVSARTEDEVVHLSGALPDLQVLVTRLAASPPGVVSEMSLRPAGLTDLYQFEGS